MLETEQPAPADSGLIPPKEMLIDGSSSPEEFVVFGDNFNQYILIPRAQQLDTLPSLGG
jgi:hypothetical protein